MFVRVLLASVLFVEVLLGWAPQADRFTWALENFPVWIGLIALVRTHRRFPLSDLCLTLLALHAVILAIGGHWTYAKVPAGDWVKEALGWARNPYDRLGHLAQGFGPVIFVRELLLRTSPLGRSKWLPFLQRCLGTFISKIPWTFAGEPEPGASEFERGFHCARS